MNEVSSRSATVRGAAWLLLGAVMLTSMGAVTKLIGHDVNPFQLTFFRALFGLVMVAPFAVARDGPTVLRTEAFDLHIARGLVSTAGMTAAAYAIVHLSMATATAIAFTTPLFIIVLAGLLLRERISPVRWIGAGVGFAGVLIISPPGGELGMAAGAAVVGALAVGSAKLLVKRLAGEDEPVTILIYLGLTMLATTSGPTLVFWQPLSGRHLVGLGAIGALSMAGQACAIQGYKAAKASAVAPVEYSRLVWAIFFGMMLFGERPTPATMVGAGVIIAGTLVATTLADDDRTPSRPPVPTVYRAADLGRTVCAAHRRRPEPPVPAISPARRPVGSRTR